MTQSEIPSSDDLGLHRAKRPDVRRALGSFAERLAATHLEQIGYHIAYRNVHLRFGEIDLVAVKDGITVLCEVRSRRNGGLESALSSLGPVKQRRMRQAAELFLALHPELPQTARIDVVAMALSSTGKLEAIAVVENAVDGGT